MCAAANAHGERLDVRLSPVSPDVHEDESTLLKAVRDQYRCPDEFLDLRASGQLSADSGYFRFGPETICYGRCVNDAHRPQPNSSLRDLLPHVSARKAHVTLPFDPNEVIDNLRLERYPCNRMGKFEKALKSVYYQLRPITNRALRVGVQRLRAANWGKRQFPQWPVDTTVENICERILLLALKTSGSDRIPFIWFWPGGARGCVSMTHDVETRAGRDFTMQLVDIDESFGIKASFQVVPEGRYEVTTEYLSEIRSHGFEICVQDLYHDGRLYDDREEFERRVVMINRYAREFGARGFRSAVLYRNLEWYQHLDFSFDMTVPNVAPLDPQRGGCCTVMPYFIGNVLELPLTTIQDYTLFHVLNERSIDLWKIQLDRILSKNGLATFLVHSDYITESETQAIYIQLLTHLKEMRKTVDLWFALPGEIDRWWRLRDRMSLVKDDKSWRIVGEGAERAVLAFAKIEDDHIVYEFAGMTPTGWRSAKVKSIC
jgi:hypothetical protein